MSDTPKLMPILLAAPGTISAKDIRRAEKLGGICIIECTNPDASRFVDAPVGASLDDQARAAIELVRTITLRQSSENFTVGGLVRMFVNSLLASRPPEPVKPVQPTQTVNKKGTA